MLWEWVCVTRNNRQSSWLATETRAREPGPFSLRCAPQLIKAKVFCRDGVSADRVWTAKWLYFMSSLSQVLLGESLHEDKGKGREKSQVGTKTRNQNPERVYSLSPCTYLSSNKTPIQKRPCCTTPHGWVQKTNWAPVRFPTRPFWFFLLHEPEYETQNLPQINLKCLLPLPPLAAYIIWNESLSPRFCCLHPPACVSMPVPMLRTNFEVFQIVSIDVRHV